MNKLSNMYKILYSVAPGVFVIELMSDVDSL
jgi:hypothetical protein